MTHYADICALPLPAEDRRALQRAARLAQQLELIFATLGPDGVQALEDCRVRSGDPFRPDLRIETRAFPTIAGMVAEQCAKAADQLHGFGRGVSRRDRAKELAMQEVVDEILDDWDAPVQTNSYTMFAYRLRDEILKRTGESVNPRRYIESWRDRKPS